MVHMEVQHIYSWSRSGSGTKIISLDRCIIIRWLSLLKGRDPLIKSSHSFDQYCWNHVYMNNFSFDRDFTMEKMKR